MSTTITFRPNRLGKMINQFGGISIATALEAAETNLKQVEDEIVAEIDRTMEFLAEAAQLAARSGEDGASAKGLVYRHAHTIASLAGNGGHGDLGVAAFNLCELADRLIHSSTWNPEAVAVNLAAMKALRSACKPEDSDVRAQVLAGLKGMLIKAPIAAPEATDV